MHTLALSRDMKGIDLIRLLLLAFLISTFTLSVTMLFQKLPNWGGNRQPVFPVVSPFIYSFNSRGTLQEASSMSLSSSPYWWLNSGGQLEIAGDVGETMQGEAPLWNYWRLLYAATNPIDTDGGKHPQNLFRLVSRSTWENVRVQAQFKILKDNWSDSPNRNASNGFLLMIRYGDDGDTLYYAGIRVDGNAVIKKKYRGTYYTLAEKKIFAGTYDVNSQVSMLPHQSWMGLRGESVTNTDGSVSVRLYMQTGSEWKKILETRDSGSNGTPPITSAGFAGIRTDFMDIALDNIQIEKI